MASSRPGKIAFATIERAEAKRGDVALERSLRDSLRAGTLVERYDRQWRMARHSTRKSNYIVGRIGFQMPGSTEELWDEESKDFVGTRLVLGTTSPFVIDLSNMRVAYQLRGGRIRPQTFIGNFQALLNGAAAGRWYWRVSPEVVGITWPAWVEDVPRVSELRVRIERPNPNYKGRKRVEGLVEGAAAEVVTLAIRAREDAPGGVNVDDAFVAEAIEQAADSGKYSARGVQEIEGRPVPVQWRSEVEGASIQREVPVDPETREADPSTLQRELETRAQGATDEEEEEE